MEVKQKEKSKVENNVFFVIPLGQNIIYFLAGKDYYDWGGNKKEIDSVFPPLFYLHLYTHVINYL